jgi:hypothetical protein
MTRRIARATQIGALALALVLVPAALAAKGGNGKPAPSAAWVTASPSPATAGGRLDLEGCGYLVEPVQIRIIHSSGLTETYGAGVYNTGCFSGYVTAGEAGTYTVEVWQASSPKLNLKASTTLDVV